MADNKPTKESLHDELTSLLATAHGEMHDAAEKIAKALDQIIAQDTQNNRKRLEAVINQAMAVPNSKYFHASDEHVKKAMLNILEHAADFLNAGLNDLIAINEKIKHDKRKLTERIKEIEEQRRGFRR